MREQIKQLVTKYHSLAEEVYGRSFDRISIDWSQRRSTIAGKAYASRWSVWINIPVHQAKPEMLEDTVAHEVAHLISFNLYGHRRGGGHGPRWQSVMIALGQTPDRTYSGTLEQRLAGKNTTRHIYQCECGGELNLSAKRHNSILRGATIWHKGCKGKALTHVRQTNKHTIIREQIAAQAAKEPTTPVVRAPAPTPTASPNGMTKLARCRALYDWTESRQWNINQFVAWAGCTTAGAATYYARIKKGN